MHTISAHYQYTIYVYNRDNYLVNKMFALLCVMLLHRSVKQEVHVYVRIPNIFCQYYMKGNQLIL